MWAAIISALALNLTSAGAIFLIEAKERAADWRAKKLAYYEEFIGAGSGIVGEAAPPNAKIRFATAVNNLHLITLNDVLTALHLFCDEIAESNKNRERDRHDVLGRDWFGKSGATSTIRLRARLTRLWLDYGHLALRTANRNGYEDPHTIRD